jgi:hypothetical protein
MLAISLLALASFGSLVNSQAVESTPYLVDKAAIPTETCIPILSSIWSQFPTSDYSRFLSYEAAAEPSVAATATNPCEINIPIPSTLTSEFLAYMTALSSYHSAHSSEFASLAARCGPIDNAIDWAAELSCYSYTASKTISPAETNTSKTSSATGVLDMIDATFGRILGFIVVAALYF